MKCLRSTAPFTASAQPCRVIVAQPLRSRPWTPVTTRTLCFSSPPGAEESVDSLSDALKADLERFKQKSAQTSSPTPSPAAQEPSSPFSSLKESFDKLLIADFFLVLFALAWLGVGVVTANANGGSSPILDAWYPLWPTLWQSAIGLLMAGALVSGGLGWIASQQNKN